jgi:predicted naringenin-chalcone synthase
MSFTIRGIGTCEPADALTPEDGLGIARFLAGPDVRLSTWLDPLYCNSGIAKRHQIIGGAVVRDILNGTRYTKSPFLPTPENDGVGPTTAQRMQLYAEHAPPLALAASVFALEQAGFEPRSITHLVTVSCTGFLAPGLDADLITCLDLRPTVERTHIGFMGCHGALNGLRVANAITTADPAARVLLCAVELCSLHYYYGSEADKLVANAIFADGAAAVAGEAGAEPWTVRASGSCRIPGSRRDMGWTVGDHGFEMSMSRRIPSQIAEHVRPWLESWLSDNGVSLEEVRSWAVHPGGPKIVAAVQECLGLADADLAASRGVFADYGNMSSPTVLYVLDRLRKANAPRPCVMLGFGPGLTAEATLLR